MEGMRETYEQPLRILMGMVVLVLVIASGNVAMLLVARNAARQREFSLRMALGGGHAHIPATIRGELFAGCHWCRFGMAVRNLGNRSPRQMVAAGSQPRSEYDSTAFHFGNLGSRGAHFRSGAVPQCHASADRPGLENLERDLLPGPEISSQRAARRSPADVYVPRAARRSRSAGADTAQPRNVKPRSSPFGIACIWTNAAAADTQRCRRHWLFSGADRTNPGATRSGIGDPHAPEAWRWLEQQHECLCRRPKAESQ